MLFLLNLNPKHIVLMAGTGIAVIVVVAIISSTQFFSSGDENVIITQIADDGIMTTNGQKHIIPLEKIKSGGPPKDGIPSIDNPKFIPASEATFVSDDEIVVGLRINGETKAYSLSILVWHEIINDYLGDTPVSVTYCPLCYSTQVFDRRINGQVVEFGVSGKLYNSNLVMYDRLTDSLWSEIMGKAIVGELTGYELDRIPFDLVKWGDWKTLYPETIILATDTGYQRPYGTDPYGDYYTDPRVLFPIENQDSRMTPKEVIVGFTDGKNHKAYRLADLELAKVVNDEIGDKKLLLFSNSPTMVRIFDRTINGKTLEFEISDDKLIDKNTNSEWNVEGVAVEGSLKGIKLTRLVHEPGFWFAWAAFYPDTEVYGGL